MWVEIWVQKMKQENMWVKIWSILEDIVVIYIYIYRRMFIDHEWS